MNIFGVSGKQLFRAKLATESVLKDAKEIRLDTGPFDNHVDNAGGAFKKYEKSGGYKQAYKDFRKFPADERQDYFMPYGVRLQIHIMIIENCRLHYSGQKLS